MKSSLMADCWYLRALRIYGALAASYDELSGEAHGE